MRKLLLIILIISGTASAQTPLHFLTKKASSGTPTIAFIAQAGAASAGGGADVTTGAINTTGANFLIAAISSFNATAAPTVSDSKANTWIALTSQMNGGGSVRTQLYYCYSPVVGSGHTFTGGNGGSSYAGIEVLAFSGTSGSFGSENGTTGGASPVSTGTVTPVTNGELIIAAFGDAATSIDAITAGFTNYDVGYTGSVNFSISIGYYVQPTAGAQGCTFTFTGSTGSAVIACFR